METLYLPSQHLCNLFRNSGFDGVAFRSAMGKGHNIVIFDPNNAEPLDVEYFRVANIDIQHSHIGNDEDIYDEGNSDYLLDN